MSRGLQILVFGVIALAQAVVILFAVPLVELHGAFHQSFPQASESSAKEGRPDVPVTSRR